MLTQSILSDFEEAIALEELKKPYSDTVIALAVEYAVDQNWYAGLKVDADENDRAIACEVE